MSTALHTTTLTVVRPAWITERGDRIADWENPIEHDITPCNVQPQSAQEITSTGTVVRSGVAHELIVRGPIGADITEHDRVRHDGVIYEVGPVQRWPSPLPNGALAHSEFTLRRMEG